MTFLPVVGRELRVAARRRGTYWSRLMAALASLAIGGWLMLLPEFRSPRTLGISLFVTLSIICYVYSLLAGLFTTADCLSEEKREGTLGLLFLTDLKGYDIVLGKLAATSLNAFYGMLAIFPVMAIPLLAGGVTGTEFWRVVLVAVNNLLFSLAVGIFCSSVLKDERKAVVLAFLMVLFITGLLPLASVLWSNWSHPQMVLLVPSPGYAATVAFDSVYRNATMSKDNYFYESVLCVHGMTWALLVGAVLIVPRTWQDRAERAGTTRLRDVWRRWAHGSAEARQDLRRRLLELNPFYWLAGRDRLKTILVWAFLAAGAGLWAWGLWRYPMGWKDTGAYIWTAIVAHTVLKCWVTFEACRRFGTDRRSGALELLLSTPLPVEEILRGQLLALFRQFAGPVAAVVLADLFFLAADRNETGLPLLWMAGMAMFVADLIALGWVGMWTGLSGRHTNRAAAAALVRVLVLPWLLFALFLTFVALSERGNPSGWSGMNASDFLVLTWAGIGLVIDVFLGSWARFRLIRDFREVATQRVAARGRGGGK